MSSSVNDSRPLTAAQGASVELPSFCAVIPMFNEQAGSRTCVERVCAELARLPNRCALMVVNDGSGDGTAEVLEQCTKHISPLMVMTHERNLGYGMALKAGATEAIRQGFDYVLFMDSDLTNDPVDIGRFAIEMGKGYDVIKASRYITGGGSRGVPFRRRFISKAGNLLCHLLFQIGIHDCTNGFRAVRSDIFRQLQLKENRFEIIVEELYQCKFVAHRFAELPVCLTNRKKNQRQTAFTYKPSTFIKYLKYALMAGMGMTPQHLKGKTP